MKKSSLFLYLILFLILGFVTLRVYYVNSENLLKKADVKFEIKKTISNDINTNKQNVINLSSINTADVSNEKVSSNFEKARADEFSKYPVVNDDTIIYKKMYKVYSNGKCGLVNSDGQRVAKIMYDDFSVFDADNGIYKSYLNNKVGLINYKGQVLIPTKFVMLKKQPYQDFCIVKNHTRYGLYDIKRAKMVAMPIYSNIESLDADNWKLYFEKNVGVVHYKNSKPIVVKPKYSDVIDEKYYIKTKSESDKFGLIDNLTGNVITEPKFDDIEFLNEKDALLNGILIFKVKADDRYGVIYYSNCKTILIQPMYTDVKYAGLVKVLSNGYWRTLDNEGNIVSR